MSGFFRFPHTPHLAWLGEGSPRDDKLLTDMEAAQLLSGDVVVEEKLDGANLGISITDDGSLRVQNRGQYLQAPFAGQFSRLSSWLALHQESLISHLGDGRILFGEWCAARHSIYYTTLPDWFMVFDVYDTKAGQFWSTSRRNELAKQLSMSVVPCLHCGKTTITSLKQLLLQQQGSYNPGPLEGIVIRGEDHDWLRARAKLVHPGFIQALDEHWSRRGIELNQIASPVSEQRQTIPHCTP
jgi:ATP-dependent RNA circularization protein (DNA/RNA ligase family)